MWLKKNNFSFDIDERMILMVKALLYLVKEGLLLLKGSILY